MSNNPWENDATLTDSAPWENDSANQSSSYVPMSAA